MVLVALLLKGISPRRKARREAHDPLHDQAQMHQSSVRVLPCRYALFRLLIAESVQ